MSRSILPRWLFWAVLALSMHGLAAAQGGIIRGVVYDKEDGEPLIYTNVVLLGTSWGAQTDEQGVYNIANVPPGTYTLWCTQLGYDTVAVSVTVKANSIVNQKIFLSRIGIQLENIDVTATKEEKQEETQISLTKITTRDIERIPAVGGTADLAQYLQVLPGVIFTGDQGGELYIRGGSPIQNKVLLDGMTIYNPFHSIGLFSVFETDIIRSVNVFTGGFSAEYGNRLSAVLDVVTRDGNKKRFAGMAAASPFVGRLVLEGPIKKQDETGAAASFLFTSKISYLDQTSPVLYGYVDSAGLPYRFQDFYGKASFYSAGGSKFSLFAFHFGDQVRYRQVSDYDWEEFGFGFNYNLVPLGSRVLIGGTFSYSDYAIQLTEADDLPRESSIGGFNLINDFTYFIPNGEVKYGFDISGVRTHLKFFNALNLIIEQDDNTTEFAGYALVRYVLREKLVLEPSLRLQYYSSLPVFSPEPRLSLKYNVSDWLRVKWGAGLYSQNLISTKSDQDVVNLFTGYLTSPQGQLLDLNGEIASDNLQRASQLVLGIEADLNDYTNLTLEPYYKLFSRLINLNRNKLFPTDPDYEIEEGKAYGVDVLLRYQQKRYYFWLAYSLGYVRRNNGEQEYPPHYDRRHNANVVAAYNWGREMSWEFALRWNLGSGFPFTLTQGFYEQINFLQGINTDYLTANGLLGIIYDDQLNRGRLPYYHRLDASLKKSFSLGRFTRLEANVSVINVYNRPNVFYFDRVRYQRVDQLPILPSAGLSLNF
ncbi:MAG: TonB-dependent receptor [Chitinophagales bacterium]|nr:TonB-dependent receptor [Chitinophagales bacterium]MDW8394515.1 TonB-dependent receptor [Chitinophagales bacterium]